MSYDDELQKLISKADKNGFQLKDGRFIKKDSNFVPVVEIFLVDNTTYESSGYYKIFKKTYILQDEDFNKILKYCKENSYKSFDITCKDNDYNLLNLFEIISKYDESDIDYININRGGKIDIQVNDYYHYTEEDEVIDIYFSKDDDNCDFPRGFMSIYMMDYNDFLNSEKVDINLEKFMKDN